MTTAQEAAELARNLIDSELLLSNKMWGEANDRADISRGQMMGAAMAQLYAVAVVETKQSREEAFEDAEFEFYPDDWSGFRDYGSDVANLVVAAAYLQNEIKRRLMNGESSYRAPRRPDQTYDAATGLPNVV